MMLAAISAFGQSELGTFSGNVKDGAQNGAPFAGVNVTIRNESTGYKAYVMTDENGEFYIEDLPLGGPYTVEFSFIGYSNATYTNYNLNMSDHIVIRDVIMNEESMNLGEVVVQGFSYKSSRDRVGSSVKIDKDIMAKLPSSSRSYVSFAELSPLTRGTNIAGSKSNMRGITLDGISNRTLLSGAEGEGAFPVSMEAIREFEVVTNTYSVADGRGGAGTIKAVTKSGTNEFHGSAWGYYTGGALAGSTVVRDGDQYKRGTKGENTIYQFGVSLSGPIIKDKLHFFALYDRYVEQKPWRLWDFESAGVNLEDAENMLGITKENMDILTEHLVNNFGVPDVKQYGSMLVNRVTENALARVDWTINRKHQLTGRFSYHLYLQPDKAPGGGLFSTQYKGHSRDNNYMLNLKSRFSQKLRNDLKIGVLDIYRTGNNVYPRVPVGVVKVTSELPNGNTQEKDVVFGNQYWAPEIISSTTYQLTDNLTYVHGKFKMLFGTDLQLDCIRDLLTHYQQGEFVYYSLENLLKNEPDEFNRKVPVGEGAGDFVKPMIFTGGIYGEVSYNPHRDVSITAGLRYDLTYLPVKPKADPLLESELGLKSDVAPLDANNIQPRLYASWDIGGKGTDILKAGAGWFVSEFTTQALSFAMINNAGNFKSVSIRKGDPNMPEANWKDYYESFDNVPGYDNWLANSSINLDEIPNSVHLLDKDLKVPMTFKTNISYTRYITDKWYVTLGLYYNRTKYNYMMENMNLKDEPVFTVDEEGGRGIYVDPEDVLSNGKADYNDARKSTRFNEVLMFTNADWANTSWNAVVETAYKVLDGEIRASYTYGQSKGGVEYTSGNPQDKFYTTTSYQAYKEQAAGWYDSDDMRHKIILTVLSPSIKGFSMSINAMAYQWDRFSSVVNLDQNGDLTSYSSNKDLSFIFDPETCPAYMKSDLEYVYNNTSKEYRKFLEENKGTFAAYNGGLNPFRFKLDVSISKTFSIRNKHFIDLRVDIFNLPNLLCYKWGGYNYVSNTNLYNVTGFDAATKKYTYEINREAGKLRYQVSDPYRVQFSIKYRF